MFCSEENACHKSCEEEKQHLKQIIGDMDKKCNSEANNVTSSSNISIQRIIMESPAPSQKSSSKTCLPNPTFDVESVPAVSTCLYTRWFYILISFHF